MTDNRYNLFLISIILFFLASCDFLGLGVDNDKADNNPQPELAWQLEDAGNLESPPPLIEGNSVFIVNQFFVARVNISDGEIEWSTELEGVVPRVFGNMVLDDDAIYLRYNQSVVAYSKMNGSKMWELALTDTLQGFSTFFNVSLMDHSDAHLFIGTPKNLLIVDKQQGSVEQTITPDVPAQIASGKRFTIPVADASNDGRVYLLTSFEGDEPTVANAHIAAYNTGNGSLIWDTLSPYGLRSLSTSSPPTLQMTYANGRLFLLTGPGVIALDAQTGVQDWERLFFEGRTDINIGNLLTYNPASNFLYAETGNRILEIDATNGSVENDITIQGTGVIERMLVVDGIIYYAIGVSANDTGIIAFDIEKGTSRFSLSQNDGFISGFTSAFTANDRFLVNIGVSSIFGYELPE